jgi:hypothetical protein
MQAQVLKRRKKIITLLFYALVMTLASCASQKGDVRLVDDPDDRRDSALPWNRQEKWEMAPDASSALGPTASSDARR